MIERMFSLWIVSIIVLFVLAIWHQMSFADVTASLDTVVVCRVTVSDRLGNTRVEHLRGIALEVIDDNTFLVDFTLSFQQIFAVPSRNKFIQISNVMDCHLLSPTESSLPGAGRTTPHTTSSSKD